jgi:CheY-like chemotaxis protein
MNALEAKSGLEVSEQTPRSEVLVVDDSPVCRKIFEQILPQDTYAVSYACTGG